MASERSPKPGSATPDPSTGAFFQVDVGEAIGFFTECSGLSMEYDVFEYQEGGVNDFVHKLRGRMKFPNLVLKRGITHEESFVKWFLSCREKTERRDLSVTMLLARPHAHPHLVVRRGVPGEVDGPGVQGERRRRSAPRPSRSPTRA